MGIHVSFSGTDGKTQSFTATGKDSLLKRLSEANLPAQLPVAKAKVSSVPAPFSDRLAKIDPPSFGKVIGTTDPTNALPDRENRDVGNVGPFGETYLARFVAVPNTVEDEGGQSREVLSIYAMYRVKHNTSGGRVWKVGGEIPVFVCNIRKAADGEDGVGIASITSDPPTGTSQTTTPVTVTLTDGTTQTFNIVAANGEDGSPGAPGTDGVSVTNAEAQTPVCEYVGVVSRWAWCRLGNAIYFIGSNGLYGMTIGESPVLLSRRLPEAFKGLGADCAPVLVADRERNGIHILLGGTTAWYYDIPAKAFWQQLYDTAIRPVSGGHAMIDGVDRTVFRCADGVWRCWDDDTEKDADTYTIGSSVIIGPFRNGQRDNTDGLLDEMTMTLAAGSADVTAKIYVGDSAEEAVSHAMNAAPYADMFTFGGGWNRNVRPRVRGAWCCVELFSSGQWAFEGLLTISKLLGRLR